MSDLFWKRFSYLFGLISFAVLFGMVVFASNIEIKDLDLWLHIGMGRFIVQNGYVPDKDILSFTIAGQPWINHEWLFQVIVYLLYENWGTAGIVNMQVVIVTITMLLLLILGYNKDKQLGVLFILLVTFLVYQSRFTHRPDLFSLLFFMLYIFILSLHVDKRWSIFALFVIQVLWTNMHGFFFFGPLFVLLGLLGEWIKRHVKLPCEWNKAGRLNNQEYSNLKKIMIAVLVACIFNPMHILGAWYPIYVLFNISGESKIFFAHIQELQRPVTAATVFDPVQFGFYKLMILFSFCSFIFNRRKIDIGVFLFWLVFLFFSLAAARNMVYFAFAAYLVFVTNFMTVSFRNIVPLRFVDRKFQYITSAAVKIIFIIWMIDYIFLLAERGYFDFSKFERKAEYAGGVAQHNYPDQAVDFLVKNQVKGNFFNDFNSGAYLIGHCFPNIKVFIDGRTEVYGPEYFATYRKIWQDEDIALFDRMVEDYNINGVLLNSILQPIPNIIFNHLFKSDTWKLVYFDYDAAVFLSPSAENQDVIDRYQIDFSNWKAQKLDLLRLGAVNLTPYQQYQRAFSLEAINLDDLAMEDAMEAIKIMPSYSPPYNLIGKLYTKRKDYQKAFENFRIAAVFDPYNLEIRYNLGLSYFDLGYYDGAIKQYQRIINSTPSDPKPYFLLSKTYAKGGQYAESVEMLRKALSLDASAVHGALKIGEIMMEQGSFEQAKQAFDLAEQSNKELEDVYHQKGVLYKKMGDIQQAIDYFHKGLEIDPDHSDILGNLEVLENVQ